MGEAKLIRRYCKFSCFYSREYIFFSQKKMEALLVFTFLPRFTYIYNFITESGPFLTHLSLLGVMSFPFTELRADNQ